MQDNKKKKEQYKSTHTENNILYEMILNPLTGISSFVGLDSSNNLLQREDFKSVFGDILPYDMTSDLIRNKVVLFPSNATEYGDDSELIKEISEFIHRYLQISPSFEKLVPFYILFTWIYDNFKELPYLRAIGDYGSGKSRFLKAIGSLCYKPIFTVGVTTPAPIFRIMDNFRGTLILDEADLKFSDTNSEVVKILNNGYQDGLPILRCGAGEKQGDYDIKSFNVFCPKIVATRNKFEDQALESRFLVEHMSGDLTRKEIRLNIGDEFEEEALLIRNKCLMWRLKNYGKRKIDFSIQDPTLEPRLNQIITPLSSVIVEEEMKEDLRVFMRAYNQDLIADRSTSFEAALLEAIMATVIDKKQEGSTEITMNAIASMYNTFLVDGEKKLSPRKIGFLVKTKFGFKSTRTRNGYVLDMNIYNQSIEKLCERYGIDNELMNVVNVPQRAREIDVSEIDF